MTTKGRLITFAGTTVLAGLYFLWETMQLPGGDQVSTLIGPRFWPLSIVFVLLGLALILLVLSVARGVPAMDGAHEPGETAEATAYGKDGDGEPQRLWHRNRHVVVLLLTIAYTIAMQQVGYLVATAAYAFAMNLVLGERRILNILVTTAVAAILVAVVFDRVLEIPLP